MAISAGVGRSVGEAVDRARSQSRSGPGRSPTTAGLPGTAGFTGLSAPGQARQRAEEAERIAKSSFLSSIARGGFFGFLERKVGEFLGIDQELAINPRGAPGFRANLNLVTMAGNAFGAIGLGTALQAAKIMGPAVGAQLGLSAASQRQGIISSGTKATGALGIPTGPDLGFAPLPGEAGRARQRQELGLPLDAENRFALDFAERQATRRAERGQGRGRDIDSDDPGDFLLPLSERNRRG